jgi:uncharacterized protein (TIGR00251 family)
MLEVRALKDGVEVAVHVRPRAAKEAVGGLHGGALQVRVQAAPADGRANVAVCRYVALALGLRPAAVTLMSGPRSRRKRLRISGPPGELTRRLEALAEAV